MTQRQFPCKECGAGMEFDPRATSLTCSYCGAANPLPQSEEDIEELDFHAFLEKAGEGEESEDRSIVKCPGCGAEATFDPNITSDECPFCSTAIVVTRQSRRMVKPRSLLPFKVDRKSAFVRFQGWLKRLWFAPSELQKKIRTEEALKGVYVPYWTYDAGALSFYRGERGDDYWDTEHYTTTENGRTVHKTRQVRRTRWTSVSGRVWNVFDDVLVLASNSLPRRCTEKLEPWDLESLTPYRDEYLSGFRAESYQIDLEQGFERAQEIMDSAIRASIRSDIGGDHQRIHSVRTSYEDVTFKHILLPIWISAYRYRQKVYRFVINARTGEVQGERPWSWAKITLAILGALAIAGGIAGLVAYFQ
ncbi:MAG: hypothetical protein JXA90_01360 [Planctomycetes bacterium]|nr:hypothetical protein [Planctomycetota bacterium]